MWDVSGMKRCREKGNWRLDRGQRDLSEQVVREGTSAASRGA